ncbi:MAG: DUF342 domain-containing protein [Candidatus Zixiibacteriota bacterium]|nr:MAG: DUF342 domain-containing protein [candidate division Zixibacteria bacterium]
MTSTGTQTGTRELVKVTISKDSMVASLLLRNPSSEESDPTFEDVMKALEAAGVKYGIDEEGIKKAVDERAFNTPLRAAEGVKPKRGNSSTIVYHFDTLDKHTPKEDEDGRIDYHDINFIQNIEEGKVLAHKIPPTEGVPGRNVYGKEISGPAGRDIPIKYGAKTVLSDDGLELRAATSGAILFQNGKVSVNDVLTVRGDVDFSVGNLDCRGSVRVAGCIKAGFELRIDGDLEVSGNVEDADIYTKGNIMIKGGFFGNGQGQLRADGDITLKYAEGQKIIAGNDLHVGGELINCQATAKEKIHIKGRRGKIVGGVTRAGKAIRTSVAGSEAGTKTDLFVAYNHKLMKRHRQISNEIARLQADGQRVKDALQALYKLQAGDSLPPDKEQALAKLEAFKEGLPGNIEALEKQKLEVEEKMKEYRDSCIIVEDTLYAGSVAHFGILYREILEDQTCCKVSLEGSNIMISAFKGD